MAHRLHASLLPRLLLLLILSASFQAPPPLAAQSAPTAWQPLAGPGGRLTHLAQAPGGRDLYAVSAAGVRRQGDQTQWRDSGTDAQSNALYASRDAGATWQPLTNDLPPGEITALYVDRKGSLWTGLRAAGRPLAEPPGVVAQR